MPKGKCPPGMLPSRAAEREAFEEAGVLGRVEKSPFSTFRQRFADGLPGDHFVVDAYRMEVIDELPTWREMHLRERRWFSVEDAIRAVEDNEIQRVLTLFSTSGPVG